MKFEEIPSILQAIEDAYKVNVPESEITIKMGDLNKLRRYCLTLQENCISLSKQVDIETDRRRYANDLYESIRKEKGSKVYLDSFRKGSCC
jgi:hypothetical protein